MMPYKLFLWLLVATGTGGAHSRPATTGTVQYGFTEFYDFATWTENVYSRARCYDGEVVEGRAGGAAGRSKGLNPIET